MSEALPPVQRWTASDGVELAYREVGSGRPVVLVHGLFSDSVVNWIKFGTAQALAARNFRVVMPDLRAHGASSAPHSASDYPPGRLSADLRELIAQLHLVEGTYDLGGFSLGARTVVQSVGEGLRPRRAILGGAGLEGLLGWIRRKDFFVDTIRDFDTIERGDERWFTVQFMKTMKIDRIAASHLLAAFENARPEWLDAFTMPTAVICGTEDHDNGSAERLAGALVRARYIAIPGTHMSSVTRPEFGRAIADYLDEPL
ncbi:alpha/beta fold hydrolase [Sphingomonas sp. ASV193]|uniref:alpha/beta fold hydrolase n=1 Tax=Sphingomonas sp. ASV193 TaxID=3144405 RepID=UPI0032E934E3